MKSTAIVKALSSEGLAVSRSGVAQFIKKFRQTGSITHRCGSGQPSKVTILDIVEQQMEEDDETTAVQLQWILVTEGCPLSLQKILRSMQVPSWVDFSQECLLPAHPRPQQG